MRFTAKSLKPAGGQIYAHIHENELSGLKRALFWSVSVEFAPLRYADDDFKCGMSCESIRWTTRDWRDLDRQELDVEFNTDGTVKRGPPGVEASFYMTSHDPAKRVSLRLRHEGAGKFATSMRMLVDFHGYAGGDRNPNLEVAANTTIPYLGLILVKANLDPKPTTIAKAISVADEFVDVSTYREPVDEGWRWLFPPKAFRKRT